MNKKEWLEVSKQSLSFTLIYAGMVLFIFLQNLLQDKPFEGDMATIGLGLGLLAFSMILGISPFAQDSQQKGMEYLLTLPYSRRRLLLIKLLPRLAAVVLFYLVFIFLYSHMGNDAFGGYFAFFSLSYFALFFIAFSFSIVHENPIIQFILAGLAFYGYLALCLYVVVLGFSWKLKMPTSWVGSGFWQDLSYDMPTLLVAIAVFFLMASPFVISFFLAFKKFDLKLARTFNRRHLLLFLPLLLLAFAVSLGGTYLVQNSSPYWESELFVLKNQRLLKADFPGRLVLYDVAGQRKIDTKGRILWKRLLLEVGDRLYLSGYDTNDGSEIIGSLNRTDLSWKVLHRYPHQYSLASDYMNFRYDGESFVYLKRSQAKTERPGMGGSEAVKTEELELVRVDLTSGKSETIMFHTPPFRRYYEPWFIGGDELNGLRFWLIARPLHNVLRIWEDSRVEDLGLSKGPPVFAGGLLFSCIDHSLQVRRLLDTGSEIVKEIAGEFYLGNRYFVSPGNGQMGEIYAERNKRIVHIDLATLEVKDIGPYRGYIWMAPPGDFYYVEFENWPPLPIDKWKKLYRLQGGKMIFLKQFDFADAAYGHIIVNSNGVIVHQWQVKSGSVTKESRKIFAFPDLKELKFKN